MTNRTALDNRRSGALSRLASCDGSIPREPATGCWLVNGARIAVASPWLLLAALSLHPEAVRAYNTTAGAFVIAVGGGLSFLAYRVMMRIGRLPVEQRVLR
jgi:hypothetical protein